MADPIRWGILGPGAIARRFADTLRGNDDSELLAVGSRSSDRASAFASEYGASRSYGAYIDLVKDPDVQVIYVATPHPLHRDAVTLCLEHGKAVLCEKPITANEAQAAEIVALAKSRRLFLMEAMWSRFLPTTRKAREWIDAGKIGEVKLIDASFCFSAQFNPKSRLFDPALAGGGLLDVGIYAVSFAAFFTREEPNEIATLAQLGETGVDEYSAMLFRYPGGAIAKLASGIRLQNANRGAIYGSDGWIDFGPHFYDARSITLRVGKEEEQFDEPERLPGFAHQIAEVVSCLREGRPESEIMPLDESVALMRTMDRVRREWGVRYPFES